MDKRIKTLINLSYYAGIAILLYLVVRYLLPVLLPFLLAFLISMDRGGELSFPWMEKEETQQKAAD